MLTRKASAALGLAIGGRSPTDALFHPPEKPRGFISFLTAPFGLARQLLAQERFMETMRPTLAAEGSQPGQSSEHLQGRDDAPGQTLHPFTKTGGMNLTDQTAGSPVLGPGGLGATVTKFGGAPISVTEAPLASDVAAPSIQPAAAVYPVAAVCLGGGVSNDSAEHDCENRVRRKHRRRPVEAHGAPPPSGNDHDRCDAARTDVAVVVATAASIGAVTYIDKSNANPIDPDASTIVHIPNFGLLGLSSDQGQLMFGLDGTHDSYPTDIRPDTAAWLFGGSIEQGSSELYALVDQLSASVPDAGLPITTTTDADGSTAGEVPNTKDQVDAVAKMAAAMPDPGIIATSAVLHQTELVLDTAATIATTADAVASTGVEVLSSTMPVVNAVVGAVGELLHQTEPGSHATATTIATTADAVASTGVEVLSSTMPVVNAVVGAADELLHQTEPVLDTAATIASMADAVTNTGVEVLSSTMPVAEAVVGTAGEVLHQAEPVLESTATTIATADAVGTTGEVLTAVAPTVEPGAPTIAATADFVAEAAADVLNAVGPVLDTATTSSMVSGLTSSLTTAPPSSATQMPNTTVAAIDGTNPAARTSAQPPVDDHPSTSVDLASAPDTTFMGSSGTIVLADPAPPSSSEIDLFSSGHYTDYGVALSAGAAEIPDSTPQTLDPALGDLSTATDLLSASPSTVQAVEPHQEVVSSLGTTALHIGDTVL